MIRTPKVIAIFIFFNSLKINMVRAGETYKEDSIIFKIVEVIPIRDFAGNEEYLIGYRIIDGGYVSPIAHLWLRKNEDIRDKIRKTIEFYKDVAHCVYPETIERTFKQVRDDINELKAKIEQVMKKLDELSKKNRKQHER